MVILDDFRIELENLRPQIEELYNVLNIKHVKEEVEELKKGELVINSADALESNYTIALICDFDDIEGLNAYQVHPAHVEFAKFIGTVKTERACIDYEF